MVFLSASVVFSVFSSKACKEESKTIKYSICLSGASYSISIVVNLGCVAKASLQMGANISHRFHVKFPRGG